MTMAFDSTAIASETLAGAIHPADRTVRPQILERERNQATMLIEAFERQTGVGALLNTSFNLHGHPIVLGPEEALFTLENSELDGVIIGEPGDATQLNMLDQSPANTLPAALGVLPDAPDGGVDKLSLVSRRAHVDAMGNPDPGTMVVSSSWLLWQELAKELALHSYRIFSFHSRSRSSSSRYISSRQRLDFH